MRIANLIRGWVSRADALALALLVLVFGMLTVAFVVRTDQMCFADCVVEFAPRLAAISRAAGRGFLTLTDVHAFAGARPVYLGTAAHYYPPRLVVYPFVDADDLGQVAAALIVAPFGLHLLWAAIGTYGCLRRAAGIAPLGAFAGAIAYALSSTMMELGFLPQAMTYSYVPWIVWAASTYAHTGMGRPWAAGVLLLGAMNFVGHPDTAFRAWFVVGLECVLVMMVVGAARAAWLRRLGALTAMGLLGLGVAGVVAAGLYTGVSWIGASDLTCEQIADFAPGSSLVPAGVLGLLFPFYLSQPGGSVVVGGGMLVAYAVLVAIASLAVRSPARGDHAWGVIGLATLVFGMFVMLGKHTPVFGLLCRTVPGFFSFPHPVGWEILVSWGLAVSCGFGVSRLSLLSIGRRSGALLLIVGGALATSTLRPEIPTFDWDRGPLPLTAYVAIAGLVLLLVNGLRPRQRAAAFVIALLIEALMAPLAHLSLAPDGRVDAREPSNWTLATDPYAELRPRLRRLLADDLYRFTGVQSFADNQAWNIDGRALLGQQAIAMDPRFVAATQAFATGHPYALWMLRLPRFLANMNTGYVVGFRLGAEGTDPPWFRRDVYRAQLQSHLDQLPLVIETQRFEVRAVPEPLPRVFVHEQVVAATADEQMRELVDGDLRRAVFVDPAVLSRLGVVSASLDPHLDVRQAFAEVQQRNRVLSFDRSDPNRIRVRVDFRRAGMLVINQANPSGWRARADAHEVELHDVNFLQQGVWLTPGEHVVELHYQPARIGYGLAVSIASLLFVGYVLSRAPRGRKGAGMGGAPLREGIVHQLGSMATDEK